MHKIKEIVACIKKLPVGVSVGSFVLQRLPPWTPFVMLICLAGLRSIPDYIYEAAEVDRASKWRQFWTITSPMVLPVLMLAVLFRGIENFKMFDMVNLLTGGGPGSITEVAVDSATMAGPSMAAPTASASRR